MQTIAARKPATSSAPAPEPSKAKGIWRSAKNKVQTLTTAFKLPLPDPPGVYEAEAAGTLLVQSTAGQHTMEWRSTLTGARGVTLPAGQCNLYAYPKCSLGGKVGVVPNEAQLELLSGLLCTIASPRQHFFFRRDASGACPIHALLIANNPEALELVLRLYREVPPLLMQTHGPGFFVGEGGLHVLAVNRREEELCEALRIADETLTTPQLIEVLGHVAHGGFFRSPPALFYGGTILGCKQRPPARTTARTRSNCLPSFKAAALPQQPISTEARARPCTTTPQTRRPSTARRQCGQS